MSARVTSKILVSAIRRRAEAEGGHAMVLARGDAMSGAVLLALLKGGRTAKLLERSLGPEGRYGWYEAGPTENGDDAAIADYIGKRRKFDPDMWILELDLPEPPEWLGDYVGSGD